MGYNDGVVVSVNMTTDMDLEHVFEITEVDAKTGELEVPFYYSVKWVSVSLMCDVERVFRLSRQSLHRKP